MRYVLPVLLIGAALFVFVACRESGPPTDEHANVITLEEGDGPLIEPGRGDTGLLPQPLGQLEVYDAVERSGDVVSTGDLRGKFAVVDFIFTSCGGTCPRMSKAMQELQARLDGAEDVVLTSFSVDPERDTPDVLSNYADEYGADKDKWLFLRMSRAHVKAITTDQLKIGDGGDVILHKSTFVLLDHEGRGRAHYEPLEDPGWLDKLMKDLDTLRSAGRGS